MFLLNACSLEYVRNKLSRADLMRTEGHVEKSFNNLKIDHLVQS